MLQYLQYLINITDNTLIPAIILSLLLLLLVRKDPRQVKMVGLIAVSIGVIIALIYTVLKRNTGIAVREYYDLGLLIPLLIITLPLLVINICLRANAILIVRLLFRGLMALCVTLLIARFMPNIMLYPFEFSVGMGSIYNTDYMYKVVGYISTLVLILILSSLVYKAGTKLSTRFVSILFSMLLLVYTVQNIITLLQILIVRRMLSPTPELMKMVMFVLGNVNLFTYIFIGMITILALCILLKAKMSSIVGSNPAQIRKLKAEQRNSRRTSLAIMAGVTFSLFTITRARYIFERGVVLTPANPIELDNNGLIIVSLEEVNDGKLHRFSYTTSNGIAVRFIIIKKSENAYGVGLDACDICGASGYYQRGDQVVCSLCDVVMNIATIGFSGGCNPVPIKFDVIDSHIVIQPARLEAEKHRFA